MADVRAALVLFVALLPAAALNDVALKDAAAQTPAPAREGYVDAGNGVRLFYRSVGRGPDTLVVLHGGPGFSMSYFAADLEPLATRHVLLFYDQRGAGRSTLVTDSTALDAQRFADDLEAVRSTFKIEKLNLFGHSWGGAVVALYATRYPDRVGRLLLLGSLPATRAQFREAFATLNGRRDSTGLRRLEERRAVRLANPGDARACRAYYEEWFSVAFDDPNAMRRTRGDFCAGTPDALANKVKSVDRYTMASLGEWDWRPSLRAVTAPTLVILGTRDFMSTASGREWAAALPNGRLLQIEGGGHFIYLERPDPFFGAVDAFLAGRWPDGAVAVPPALADTLTTLFDSLSAIHRDHPDTGILRRLHPPADSIQFVEGPLIETLTGDSLYRRVLALHVPVRTMAQQFTNRTASLLDADHAVLTATEHVDWVDAGGAHRYAGVLTIVVSRRGPRWVIRSYRGS